ncbi:MAG: hypothetical protein RIR66_653 [Actinomycetota bacterium]|jgi:hypothetical protein
MSNENFDENESELNDPKKVVAQIVDQHEKSTAKFKEILDAQISAIENDPKLDGK